MGKAPAFQLYAGDLLTDVMDWTDEEVGVHIRLLCWSWVNRRGIPRDTRRLTRIASGAESCWPTIGSKWIEGPDDTWVNERLEKTRTNSDTFRAKQKEKSLLAVAKRSSNSAKPTEPVGSSTGSPVGDPLEGEEEDSITTKKKDAKVELIWPRWAGDQTKTCWNTFKEYRKASHKFTYRTHASEQAAITLLSKMFTTGEKCFDGLQECMAKGWKFPVDPNDRMVNGKGSNGSTTGKTYDGWTVERIEAWMNDYKANNGGSYPNSGTANVPKAYKLWKEWI